MDGVAGDGSGDPGGAQPDGRRRFPDDACAVIAQVAQFQPIAQSDVLKMVVRDPEGYSIPQVLRLRTPGRGGCWSRRTGWRARHRPKADPTGGALYFVNPDYMNPTLCPWFAALKRTTVIGGHVFMTHYRRRRAAGAGGAGLQPGGSGLGRGALDLSRMANFSSAC